MEIYVLATQNYDGSDIQSVSLDIKDIKNTLIGLKEEEKEYKENYYYEFYIYKNGTSVCEYTGDEAEKQVFNM